MDSSQAREARRHGPKQRRHRLLFWVVCAPTWSTLAWMGAVVLRTYFFVAQPAASKEPATMHVVARKTLISFKNLDSTLAILRPFGKGLFSE